MMLMDIGHSVEELVEISAELCARNEFRGDTYLRAIVFKNLETIGVKLRGIPDTTAIIAVPHKNYYEAGTACGSASAPGGGSTTPRRRCARRSPGSTSTPRWPKARRR